MQSHYSISHLSVMAVKTAFSQTEYVELSQGRVGVAYAN
jgi:hypothetical protein